MTIDDDCERAIDSYRRQLRDEGLSARDAAELCDHLRELVAEARADAATDAAPPGAASATTDAQVDAGCREPVDYLAIGPVFATRSKARPDPVVGLEGVRRAVAIAGPRPVVAIGGITLDRVSEVLSAGASSVAVISDLLLGDPEERARQFVQTTASTPR